jgi:hypothetical protein
MDIYIYIHIVKMGTLLFEMGRYIVMWRWALCFFMCNKATICSCANEYYIIYVKMDTYIFSLKMNTTLFKWDLCVEVGMLTIY